jgi:predicted ArsR family transcriptional regulator
VTYLAQKHGIGRPVFVYRLAEEAEKLFPKSYDQFALDILRNIEKYDGTVDIETIFLWRKNSFLKKCNELLQGTTDLVERIHLLKGILESEGHLVDIFRNNGYYHLISYNCPISKIAVEFQDACRNELEMYKELISPQATLKQTQAEGNVSCILEFPFEN